MVRICSQSKVLCERKREKLLSKEIDKAKAALAKELPAFRAQIGISQDELCQTIGITRQTYSHIEIWKKPMF
jgi:DNA-binding helix-turn-helix protein